MDFTKSQKLAIDLRDRNILVSAAAGSGKTATLTERIIQLLTDKNNPADISRMLIVTFTRAAAGELRTRISKALSKALADDPSNRHIAKQLTTLGGAQICTIDAYYLDLVITNFQRLGLPAAFRLADETELMLLRNETMEALINRRYETDPDFIIYADRLTTAKGEYKLSELLLDIVSKIITLPDGTAYLEKCARKYSDFCNSDFFQTTMGNIMSISLEEEVSDMIKRCDHLLKLIDSEPSAAPYGKAVASDKDFLSSLLSSLTQRNYSNSRMLIYDYKATAFGRVSKDAQNETTEQIKEERNIIKNRINELKEEEFAAPPEDIPLFCQVSRDFCIKTKEIIDDYIEAYTNEKNNRKICEFSDLRKYARLLLIDKDGNPTEIAKEQQQKYDHIFVDEYQDTDSLQDQIFNTISNGKNLFFVGDIKQSIYSFRGAEPSVFSKYRKQYLPVEFADDDSFSPISIYMSNNFRCSPNIISFTNTVCSYLFRESEGNNSGIGYIAEDDLIASRLPPYSEEKVRVVMLEDFKESGENDIEAAYVISEIRRLLKEGKKSDGTSIMPGDIAILTRSNKEATKMADALAKAGIPRANSTGNDLFENPEVLLMLCLLTASDNPQRDIPLAGALRSPIFGFSMSDLVNIRIARNNMSLYDAMTDYSLSEESDYLLRTKCVNTINKLNEYRKAAEAKPVHLFMRYLWNDTNALAYAGSDSRSNKRTPIERRRNLRKFYEYARRFESSSFKGLHEFIGFINGIIDKGTKITDEDSFSQNTVRIMTVHKSKGLEFPIVFLTGTNKYSGEKDSRNPIVFTTSDDLGIACKVSNDSGSVQIDTPFRLTILNKLSEISSDEEIRILYVALTRARDNLYIVASGKDGFIDKKLSSAMRIADIGGRYGILSSPRWIDRILIALASDKLCSSYVIDFPDIKAVPSISPNAENEIIIDAQNTERIYNEIKASVVFKYPYDSSSEIPAKVSVSKLYPDLLNDDSDSESIIRRVKNLDNYKPRFLAGKTGAAERGTATHLFLQYCDFNNLSPTRNSVLQEINRLVTEEYLTNDIAELIRVDEIIKFVNSKLFNDITEAQQIHKEMRFNIFLPASEFTSDIILKETYSEQNILVQGVIDLCYINRNNELILCDYKTDRIPNEIKCEPAKILEMLESTHKQQLKYYSYAVNSIFGRKPDKIFIYSLAYGDTFEITI